MGIVCGGEGGADSEILCVVVQVEEYGQQLALSAKVLDSPRGHDDHHHHSPRHTSTSSHSHNHNGKNDSQCELIHTHLWPTGVDSVLLLEPSPCEAF